MPHHLAPFQEYLLRVLPGTVVVAILLSLLPKTMRELRVMVYIVAFVLYRDVMTPSGYWSFDTSATVRMAEAPSILVAMGCLSLSLVLFIDRVEPALRPLLVWARRGWSKAVLSGIIGACAIALPTLLFHHLKDPTGGPLVSRGLWPAILVLALLGNLLEEVLFRGYLQGLLAEKLPPVRALLATGFFFSVFHSFLASTVTDVGAPILVFTAYEGLVCAGVQARWGLLGSVLAHGGGIFLLASGMF